MDFNEYLNDYDKFTSMFEMSTPNEYYKIIEAINIPLNFLTKASLKGFEISDFENSVRDQMYWTMNALKKDEDIYEDISFFMNSYTFHPPIWILSRLIGFIIGCIHYKFSWDKDKLLSIATNSAFSDNYVKYINNCYYAIMEVLGDTNQKKYFYDNVPS